MKEGIHPKYEQTTIRCACGNSLVCEAAAGKAVACVAASTALFFKKSLLFIDTIVSVRKSMI